MQTMIAHLIQESSAWQALIDRAYLWTEINATLLGILYVFLLVRENIWCWPAGILSSLLSIGLFLHVNLYAEAILYSYYVFIGFYGWWQWQNRQDRPPLTIRTWPWARHLVWIGIIAGVAVLGGMGFASFTDAQRPYIDAQTTTFSFFASYLEATKVLGGWVYWIGINALSIWLYADRELNVYTWLMVLNTVLSFVGYWTWRSQYRRAHK